MVAVSWASWDTIVSRDSKAAIVADAVAARTEDELETGERRAIRRRKETVSTNNSECRKK